MFLRRGNRCNHWVDRVLNLWIVYPATSFDLDPWIEFWLRRATERNRTHANTPTQRLNSQYVFQLKEKAFELSLVGVYTRTASKTLIQFDCLQKFYVDCPAIHWPKIYEIWRWTRIISFNLNLFDCHFLAKVHREIFYSNQRRRSRKLMHCYTYQ